MYQMSVSEMDRKKAASNERRDNGPKRQQKCTNTFNLQLTKVGGDFVTLY